MKRYYVCQPCTNGDLEKAIDVQHHASEVIETYSKMRGEDFYIECDAYYEIHRHCNAEYTKPVVRLRNMLTEITFVDAVVFTNGWQDDDLTRQMHEVCVALDVETHELDRMEKEIKDVN